MPLPSIPLFVKIIGTQFLAEIADTFVEASVDSATDLAIDKANDAINKLFPTSSDPNSFTNMFMQNVKMQTTVKAQARMMAFSMQNQQKAIQRIDDFKEKVRLEKENFLKNNKGNILTQSKIKRSVNQKEQDSINQVVGRVNTSINGQLNASNQVGAFTQGLGTTKMAYDQANNTDLATLNALLTKLINGQGFYASKGEVVTP